MECNFITFGCKRASTKGFTNEARYLLLILSYSLSYSLSRPAKVEKCGIEVRTSSPQKEEDGSLYSFFSNVEMWRSLDKMDEFPKTNRGGDNTHTHAHARTHKERERERCCRRRVIIFAREFIIFILTIITTQSRKAL